MHYSGISGSAIALPPTVEKLPNDAKDQKRRESNSRTNKAVVQKSVESLKLAEVNDGVKKTKPHEHSERCKEFEEIAVRIIDNSIQFNTDICTCQLINYRIGGHDEQKLTS